MVKKNGYKTTANIREIKDNIVFLNDNTLLAVLEVTPIDFDKMPESKKQNVMKKYLGWLESLDFPVQIVARTVNSDTVEQAKILKNKIEHQIKQKEEYRDLLTLFKEFETWFDSYVAKNSKQRRIYYITIPFMSPEKPSMLDKFMKSKAKDKFDLNITLLNKRVSMCIDMLKETGVKLHRLETGQLENLYDSYFTIHNQIGVNENSKYLKPNDWFEMWKNVMANKG